MRLTYFLCNKIPEINKQTWACGFEEKRSLKFTIIEKKN